MPPILSECDGVQFRVPSGRIDCRRDPFMPLNGGLTIDTQVVFHALSEEHIRQIVDLMLKQVISSVGEKSITLEVPDAARDLLGRKGYDPDFGARPLRRTIQNLVEDPLSERLLRGDFQPGDTVCVDCVEDKIVMQALV